MPRPRLPFDPEAADEICERIANGESLRSIVRNSTRETIPGVTTIFKWLDEFPLFAKQYAQACEMRADAFLEDMLEIAKTPQMGIETKTNADGVETKEGDMIQHRRLQIETLKWVMGKMKPKKYGEVKATEADDGTVKIEGGLPD